jgi:hypothetical protein
MRRSSNSDPHEHGPLKGHPYETAERAAIIEFDGNVPRDVAERMAIEAEEKENTND